MGKFPLPEQTIHQQDQLALFQRTVETFGGVDYNMNKLVAFSVNFVNFFNQKGCSGSIGAADLLEDVSAYKNYVMAGTYIRPFTVEFTTRLTL